MGRNWNDNAPAPAKQAKLGAAARKVRPKGMQLEEE